MAQSLIGRVLSGRYLVQSVVGSGGMAVVYRGWDKRTNGAVAIKVLRPEFVQKSSSLHQFEREAEAAHKVSHENIVNMLDVGRDGDVRYIVMELIEGQTLKEMIREEGAIPVDKAAPMIARILAAANHAHKNGIVHRDIKPQNILVTLEGQVKIADFGIARLRRAGAAEQDEGKAIGSAHYMSPEQAAGEVADYRSDIYSIGIVCYEMLTGRVPFESNSPEKIAEMHVKKAPVSMRSLKPSLSKGLDEVIARALCKEPERRYQTAEEMALDLAKALEQPEGGFVNYPVTEEEVLKQRENRKKRHKHIKRLAVGLIVLSVLTVMGFGIFCGIRLRNTFVMPPIVGRSIVEAENMMKDYGVRLTAGYCYSEDYPKDVVLYQQTRAGLRTDRHSEISVTVSLGTQFYTLEVLNGIREDEALSILKEHGVVTVSVQYEQSDTMPQGCVIGVNLEPGHQNKETPVILTVSGQCLAMPMLEGLRLEGAQALLEAQGLSLGEVTEEESPDNRAGTIIAQSITPDAPVLYGSAVDVTVSAAHEPVYYPESRLTVYVPLPDTRVRIVLKDAEDSKWEGYNKTLNKGMYRILLSSVSPGTCEASVYMDDVLIETVSVEFR